MEKAFVFDKARFHLDSVREHGLEDHQAYVHAGLFFGWAVSRGLVLPWVERGVEDAFAAFRRGALTGPGLFAACDGALLDDQFTDEGLAFVTEYYPFRTGQFLDDYVRAVGQGLPSEFHVEDTPANAERLTAILDARFADWRTGWDAARGRPNLRGNAPPDVELASSGRSLRSTLVLPVIPVTAGVALPHGSLGIRVARPESLAAVAEATATDRRVALLPTTQPGRRTQVRADELLDGGVVAEIESTREPVDRPGARDIVLSCLARIELDGWVSEVPLVARFHVVSEPDVDDDQRDAVDAVRTRAAEIVRKRIDRGESPGGLLLAAAAPAAALVDLVARELPASREELLTVLLAPDLATRLAVVTDLVTREP